MGLKQALYKLDGSLAMIEQSCLGWISKDFWLFLARFILGAPLIMNGLAQMAQPEIMIAQMNMYGVSVGWMWPAIMASFLGGLALVLGWRIRTAAILLVIYTAAATYLFHGSFLGWENKAVSPPVSLEACRWWVGFEKLPAASDEFIRGCGFYKTLGDLFIFQKHVTMLIPALLLLMGGAGRFSLEARLEKKRGSAPDSASQIA